MTAAVRLPAPKDFPSLFTRREVARFGATSPRRTWPTCSVCNLVIEPRNRQRHAKACARRKRLAPALWREWWCDMHGKPADSRDRPSNWPPERVSERERRFFARMGRGDQGTSG